MVNDGGTDNFAEAVSASQSPHYQGGEGVVADVKVITQPNQGAPTARNKGFANSKGVYVIFWDADTLANPQIFAKKCSPISKNTQTLPTLILNLNSAGKL